MSFKQFVEDTKAELKKVSWPTKHKVIQSTLVVLVVVIVMTMVVSLLDVILGNLFDIMKARF
jgi:preprotein translocase subunit SecE